MHPAISIGAYLILQVAIWFLLIRNMKKSGLHPAGPIKWVAFGIYALLSLLPVFGALLPDSDVKFALQGAGNIWLAFVLYTAMLVLLLNLIGLVVEACIRRNGHEDGANDKDADRMHKQRILHGLHGCILIISLTVGIGAAIYGMIHAQKTVVRTCDVYTDKEAGDRKNLKVVLLGDLHLSVNSNLPMIGRMVNAVNALSPDVVVIAGDIFTSSYGALKDPDAYAAVLRRIEAKDGVYAVYGNHDVEETLFGGFPISPISQAFRTKDMEDFMEKCGFTVLYDETALIADGAVQLVGRVDGEKAGDGTDERMSAQEVLAGIDPEKYTIVLEHEPVEFGELKANGADLALCGHTHAGQLFPGNIASRFFFENIHGYKKVDGLDTVVTAGVGYYGPPMRVATDSEITEVDVHFGDGSLDR